MSGQDAGQCGEPVRGRPAADHLVEIAEGGVEVAIGQTGLGEGHAGVGAVGVAPDQLGQHREGFVAASGSEEGAASLGMHLGPLGEDGEDFRHVVGGGEEPAAVGFEKGEVHGEV